MACCDSKTDALLNVLGNGGSIEGLTGSGNTKTQNYLVDAINRVQNLEDEVERLENNPDVADIVATYSDLENYDKTQLTDKDVIRVLQDSTHNDESTYYRYDAATGEFTYIGTSKQYTDFVGTDGAVAGQSGLVPAPATTDADKFLKSDGTWAEAGGGGGVTPVQTTGSSTTDVMSQAATTDMVYTPKQTSTYNDWGAIYMGNKNASNVVSPDPSTTDKHDVYFYALPSSSASVPKSRTVCIMGDSTDRESVAIGQSASTGGYGVSIGTAAHAYSNYSNAIGYSTETSGATYSVALGAYAKTTQKGEVNIGTGVSQTAGYNSSNYRVIRGVYDGEQAHDAVTVGQINAMIDNINTALSTNIPHIGAQS